MKMKITEHTKFSLQTLHEFKYSEKDDTVVLSAAMSPILTAQAVAKSMDIPLVGVVRVWFKDEHGDADYAMYQQYDPYPDLTGCDHLIVMMPWCFILCTERDLGVHNIAMTIYTDTKAEHNLKNDLAYAKRLSDTGLVRLLDEIVSHIRVIAEESRVAYQHAKTFKKEKQS